MPAFALRVCVTAFTVFTQIKITSTFKNEKLKYRLLELTTRINTAYYRIHIVYIVDKNVKYTDKSASDGRRKYVSEVYMKRAFAFVEKRIWFWRLRINFGSRLLAALESDFTLAGTVGTTDNDDLTFIIRAAGGKPEEKRNE